MNTVFPFRPLAIALLCAVLPGQAMADGTAPDSMAAVPAHATGYLLVKPKAGVSDETYRAILAGAGAEEFEREEHDLYRKAIVPAGQEQAIADQLATHPLIE